MCLVISISPEGQHLDESCSPLDAAMIGVRWGKSGPSKICELGICPAFNQIFPITKETIDGLAVNLCHPLSDQRRSCIG